MADDWQLRHNNIFQNNIGMVNIGGNPDKTIYICGHRCSFNIAYPSSHSNNPIQVYNINNILRINYDNNETASNYSLVFNNSDTPDSYVLRDIIITVPSKHTLHNKRSDAEMFLIHESTDGTERFQILSVLLNKTEYDGSNSHKFYKTIGNKLKPEETESEYILDYSSDLNMDIPFNIKQLLPTNKSFFSYNATPKVNFIVYKDSMTIPSVFYENYISNVSDYSSTELNTKKEELNSENGVTIYSSNISIVNENTETFTNLSEKIKSIHIPKLVKNKSPKWKIYLKCIAISIIIMLIIGIIYKYRDIL
jgi:carbonic anhydrase